MNGMTGSFSFDYIRRVHGTYVLYRPTVYVAESRHCLLRQWLYNGAFGILQFNWRRRRWSVYHLHLSTICLGLDLIDQSDQNPIKLIYKTHTIIIIVLVVTGTSDFVILWLGDLSSLVFAWNCVQYYHVKLTDVRYVTASSIRHHQTATSLCSVPAWRWWYIGPVVVGNVGDNSASSYRVHASETQQLSYVPMVDATPICTCVELLGQSRQPMTGRLATHPSNAAVNR